MQSRRLPLALLIVALGLVAASCVSVQVESPTLAPSRTPQPTFTPTAPVTPLPLFTPAQAQAAEPAITQTAVITVPIAPAPTIPATVAVTVPTAPAASITETAAVHGAGAPALTITATAVASTPPQFTADDAVNVRQGPSTDYDLMGQVQPQTSYKLLAKNQDASWLEFNYNGDPGWVSSQPCQSTTGDLSQPAGGTEHPRGGRRRRPRHRSRQRPMSPPRPPRPANISACTPRARARPRRLQSIGPGLQRDGSATVWQRLL